MAMGFRHVESGPLVRSSYHAWEQVQAAGVVSRDRESRVSSGRRHDHVSRFTTIATHVD